MQAKIEVVVVVVQEIHTKITVVLKEPSLPTFCKPEARIGLLWAGRLSNISMTPHPSAQPSE